MRRRWHHGVAILAALVLFVVLAGGCGGGGGGNRQGDLVGSLHGELAKYLKEELGLDPAMAELDVDVEGLADLVLLSDPAGVRASHPGLALLKDAFASGRAVALENADAEEIAALLRQLGTRGSFTIPDGEPTVELFAMRRVGGDWWHFIDAGGATSADLEGDDGAARNRGRVRNFVDWIEEGKRAATAKASAATDVANDLTQLAEAKAYRYEFTDFGQTFTIRYTVYSCHSFTNDMDYYFVEQSSQLNPSALWKHQPGKTYIPGYWVERDYQEGHMRSYSFKNYWPEAPGSEAPLDRHSPESANGETSITSGISWNIGGSVGFSGKSAAGSLSGGVSVSTSQTFNIQDCKVDDQGGSSGRADMAAWEYRFADPAIGDRKFTYASLKDAPLLARSNFQPVDQWIWTVPTAFSKKVRSFRSEFSWIDGKSWGPIEEWWYIQMYPAKHEPWMSMPHMIEVPIERPPLLAIAPGQMDFTKNGESRAMTLVSALEWTASSSAEWLHVDEGNGQKTEASGVPIHVTVDPNDSGADRKATVTLRSTDGTETQTLNVFQSRY